MNLDAMKIGLAGLVPRGIGLSRNKQKKYDCAAPESKEESNESDVDELDRDNDNDTDELPRNSHLPICTNTIISFDEGYASCSNTFFSRGPDRVNAHYSTQSEKMVTNNLFRRVVNRYCKAASREKYPVITDDSDYEDLELTPTTVTHEVRMVGDLPSSTLPVSTYFPLQTKDIHVSLNPDGKQKLIHSVSEDDGQPDEEVNVQETRETWNRNIDFLLSIIGFAVDLANVWRFPYLCYRNGGGAFLIPYALMLIFGAVPLFYMEVILGQYNRQGPISIWKICPIFKGIGFCAVLIAFYVSFYYNVIIGWSLYFLVASVAPELPWLHCNNSWNTDGCIDFKSNYTYFNSTNFNTTNTNLTSTVNASLTHSPAWEYFHRAVLETQWSTGLNDIGLPKIELLVCLFVVYVMLYLSLFKGVKSTGVVVWATATLPYVVLTILLVRGLMLPGALRGIVYYLKPQLARLADTQVWVDAAVQVFYSVGAGFGVHLSYASYNNFNNDCYRDCLITTAVNCFTSFFSGFVIFTYLGYMSDKQGVPISSVATEGPGLVFQVYPEAVATLPGSQIWAVLFFFMLIMLGIDSAMGGLECVITGLMDEFCSFFAGKKHAREIFTACAIVVSFCVATINVTPGGIYMFQLFDTYSAGISLLCSALFEAIAVSWFYGLERFTGDVELMLGRRPGLYWRICWKFISPTFIIGVVVFGLLDRAPLKYNEYTYPMWAELFGWGLTFSSILMIPSFMILQLCRAKGSLKEKLAYCITPVEEHRFLHRGKKVPRFRTRHWLYV